MNDLFVIIVVGLKVRCALIQMNNTNMTICIIFTHIDTIFDELLGSDFKRCFTLLDKATCKTVFNVGELMIWLTERVGERVSCNVQQSLMYTI